MCSSVNGACLVQGVGVGGGDALLRKEGEARKSRFKQKGFVGVVCLEFPSRVAWRGIKPNK